MNGIFEGLFDSIQQRFVDALQGLSEFWYLAGWYGYFAVLVVVCIIIRIFLPFKWVQASLAIAVGMGAAFLAGLQVMANHYKAQRELDRERIKELETAERPKRDGGGWFPFS